MKGEDEICKGSVFSARFFKVWGFSLLSAQLFKIWGVMDVLEKLNQVKRKALEDESLGMKFLATRDEAQPLQAFCQLCRELGYEIYPMEIIEAGDDEYAAMKRSTNGGGENSPELIDWEHDVYGEFFTGLNKQ